MPFFDAHYLRPHVIKWVSHPRFTHAVTLNPNWKDLQLGTFKRMFGKFCLEVDRLKAGGRQRVDRKPTWDRFEAIAFPEHIKSNIHLHAVCNFDPRHWNRRRFEESELRAYMETSWSKITKEAGTIDLKPRDDSGWGKYITKEIYRKDHDFLLAADFHPNDRVVDYGLNEQLDKLVQMT